MEEISQVLVVVCLVAILVIALFAIACARFPFHVTIRGIMGCGPTGNTKDLVIDTLNILHYLGMKPSDKSIRRTIEKTIPIIRKKYPGRIMYVVKDRDAGHIKDETKKMYESLAKKHMITIASVEKYKEQPNAKDLADHKKNKHHAAQGRDDYYALYLATKFNCWVLTNDKFKDAEDFKKNLIPFRAHEYHYHKKDPDQVFIKPKAENTRLTRIRRIQPKHLGIEAPTSC